MLRAFLSSFSVILIGVGCAFLTHMILAKILNAAEYGVFSFVYSISLLLSVISLFGFQNSVVRLIPNYQSHFDKIKGLIKFSRVFTFFVAILSALICFACLQFFGLDEKYPIEALYLSFLITPLMVSMRLHAAFMRGFEKSMLSVLYETSLREVLLLSAIGISFLIGHKISSGFDALILLTISLFLVSIVAWWNTRFTLHQKTSSSDRPSFEVQEWITISLPMMFTIFAQRLLRRSDIIILGAMVTPALVGAYAIVTQFSDVSAIGQKGVFAVFSARAASLYKSQDITALRTLYCKMQLYGVLSAAALCLCIGLIAPYLLDFFGEEYRVAYYALIILLVGQFINVCFGPIGILMIMTQYERVIMKFTFIVAIGNIILNPIAIYFYGLEGAAIVTSFFLVCHPTLSYLFMKKKNIL